MKKERLKVHFGKTRKEEISMDYEKKMLAEEWQKRFYLWKDDQQGYVSTLHSPTPFNEALEYGIEIDSYLNNKWAKIVFKVNSVGNLVLEISPSLTPGVLSDEVRGRVEKGTKIFNYDSKQVYSMPFKECVAIVEFNKKKYDFDNNGQPIKLSNITSLQFFRNTDLFAKKMTIGYNDSGAGNYLVNMNFEMTNTNGITSKIKLPVSLDNFEIICKYFETYINQFYMIQYFNAVEKAKDDRITKMFLMVMDRMDRIDKSFEFIANELEEIKKGEDNNEL